MRIALTATCGFLAAEPDFARLRSVAVYEAGPEAIAERDAAGSEILATLLARGPGEVANDDAEACRGKARVWRRAVGGTVVELLARTATRLAFSPERSDDVSWVPDWATSRFDVEKP